MTLYLLVYRWNRDEHFRHFVRHYPETPFRVAVSTEVVLQHEGDPATRTLAFVNVVPQTAKAGDRQGNLLVHHRGVVNTSPSRPSIWQTILDNSEHLSDAEHQRIISNWRPGRLMGYASRQTTLTRFPGGKYLGSRYSPNLLANQFPGLTLPVVNITGSDLGDLTECSFNLFGEPTPQPSPALELPAR